MMRSIASIFALLLLQAGLCAGQPRSVRILVENPGEFVRDHETVGVSLDEVARLLKTEKAEGFVVTTKGNNAPLLTQTTDRELLFQSNFAPREKKEFLVTTSAGGNPVATSLVDGRFVPPREDYAWENDRIAFRMYGPALAAEVNNGIDVWTKRVPYLIVAKWYKESEGQPAGKDTYHQDRGEGADFFEVGRSLGAGGSGLWHGGKVIQPGVFSSYSTICQGPIRVSFELTYKAWNIEGKALIERKRISLDAGQYLNRVDVTFEGPGRADTLQIAVGLVKRVNTVIQTNGEHCWMGLWGLTNADSVNGSLGTGVVLPSARFVRFTEDPVQYLAIGKINVGQTFTYYAGAGWTRNSNFVSGADWGKYLDYWRERISVPLKVSCSLAK